MSLESWWKALAKERTERVKSRTARTIARQEAAARTAEAKYGRRKPVVTADTGEVVMPPQDGMGSSWYLPVALVIGLGLLSMRQKD
jgi:hypothetical protein